MNGEFLSGRQPPEHNKKTVEETTMKKPALKYTPGPPARRRISSRGHFGVASNGNSKVAVVVSNFNFGPGGATSDLPDTSGDATGNLLRAVRQRDTGELSDFTATFVPGQAVAFDVQLTLNLEGALGADEFTIAIVDSSGQRISRWTPMRTTCWRASSPARTV